MNQFKLGDFVYPKKLPWEDILQDLYDNDVTPSQIANLLGFGWSSFQRLKNGSEPKYSVGVSILILHTRYCGEELTRERVNFIERRST